MAVATINQSCAEVDKALDAVSAWSAVRSTTKMPETMNQAWAKVAKDSTTRYVAIRLGKRRAVLVVEALEVWPVLSATRGARRDEGSISKVDADMPDDRIRHSGGQPRSAR